MLQSLKSLLVVLVIATLVFRLTKSVMLLYTPEKDLLRRRTLWYVLTVAAFLSPSPWLYAVIAVPLLLAAGSKDSNPTALYLFLLHVTPGLDVDVPLIGRLPTQLVPVTGIILPAAYQLFGSKSDPRVRRLQWTDGLLLAYLALSSALYIHQIAPDGRFYPATTTDFIRRLFFAILEMFLPYFVISRSIRSRRELDDSIASLWLPCILMAAIAVFESVRGWLLYDTIVWDWGGRGASFLIRGESLRAMASAGHPLALGYLLAVAFGCWLYLQLRVQSKLQRLGFTILLWLGEFAAYSRGPWMCAVLIFFLFTVQRPRAISALTKSLVVAAVAVTVVAFSPFGEKVANVFPSLGGHVDTANIDYRQRLWDRGWQEIWRSPLFGDQYVLKRMQDLRQGEGIIDIVNGYVAQLLATGFVGLSLFLSVVLIAVYSCWRASGKLRRVDEEFSMAGGSLVACLLGTLFLWAFGGPELYVLWALVGLACAYSFVGQQQHAGLAPK